MTHNELRVEIRIRNNILWHAIYDLWPSTASFCRKYDLQESTVIALINLRLHPTLKTGQYRKICQTLAALLGYSCEELFPLYIYEGKENKISMEIPFSQLNHLQQRELAQLPSPKANPIDSLLEKEPIEKLQLWLNTLKPFEKELLSLTMGLGGKKPWTFDELANKFGLTLKEIKRHYNRAERNLSKAAEKDGYGFGYWWFGQ